MAVYNLPDLPYDYGALEPAMSGEILERHGTYDQFSGITWEPHVMRDGGR
ncbi:superoxide dismutase [Micromonospora profundi]|nr:hypothetical protein [Micromonospora profundi]NJC12988.1 superoxide dismutase [Micromonospora profundi]